MPARIHRIIGNATINDFSHRHGFLEAAFDPTGPVPVESRSGNYTRRLPSLSVIPRWQWEGVSRLVVKPYSTGTGPVRMPPKIRDGQNNFSHTPASCRSQSAERLIFKFRHHLRLTRWTNQGVPGRRLCRYGVGSRSICHSSFDSARFASVD